MFFVYDILYLMGFVFYLPVLLFKGKLHSGFKQRFSFLGPELRYRLYQKSNIWFHAVSVGEVLAIVGLVEKIRLSHPNHQIIISTVTTTGYSVAQQRFSKDDVVIFAPLDLGWVVRRFIDAIRPEIFIIAETEIWPNLLRALAQKDIPLVMVNGRISNQSFYRYLRFSFLFEKIFRSFRSVCMQSVNDADRIIALGALPKNVTVLGSMKFDDVSVGDTILPARIGFQDDALIWVAGSTHPGEERIVVDVFKKLRIKFPALSLIIAPRHIERSKDICTLIRENGCNAVTFSSLKPQVADSQAVVVVDTIGHLKSFYAMASVVFVGKSLVGQGGQNIIEPAFFGKPIIVGPYMQNFSDIIEIFLDARAILQIEHAGQLQETVDKLLIDSDLRNSLGQRALLTVKKNQGAINGIEKIISDILNTPHFHKAQ